MKKITVLILALLLLSHCIPVSASLLDRLDVIEEIIGISREESRDIYRRLSNIENVLGITGDTSKTLESRIETIEEELELIDTNTSTLDVNETSNEDNSINSVSSINEQIEKLSDGMFLYNDGVVSYLWNSKQYTYSKKNGFFEISKMIDGVKYTFSIIASCDSFPDDLRDYTIEAMLNYYPDEPNGNVLAVGAGNVPGFEDYASIKTGIYAPDSNYFSQVYGVTDMDKTFVMSISAIAMADEIEQLHEEEYENGNHTYSLLGKVSDVIETIKFYTPYDNEPVSEPPETTLDDLEADEKMSQYDWDDDEEMSSYDRDDEEISDFDWDDDENAWLDDESDLSIMSYDEYTAAPVDTKVKIETYVQAKQSWWENKATLYTADKDGAYFIYNAACSQEDYDKLVEGQKIIVTGYKAEWGGEIEIADATFEIVDGNYISESRDVTSLLGTDELTDYMNQKAEFKGLTVGTLKDADGNDASFIYNWDGSGQEGDDLYFSASMNGETYLFVVESYLCDETTEVYQSVKNLKIGDVVDLEGFLYWYEGPQPHITKVNVIS